MSAMLSRGKHYYKGDWCLVTSLSSGQLSRYNVMYALLKCGQRNQKWRPAGHQKSQEGSQKFVLKRSLRLLLKSPSIDSALKKSRKVKLLNFTPLLIVINAFCTLIEKNKTIKHSSIASVVKRIYREQAICEWDRVQQGLDMLKAFCMVPSINIHEITSLNSFDGR